MANAFLETISIKSNKHLLAPVKKAFKQAGAGLAVEHTSNYKERIQINKAVHYAHFKLHKCSGLARICKTEIVVANAFLETKSIRSNKHLLAPVKERI